jgi:hypothetical protein
MLEHFDANVGLIGALIASAAAGSDWIALILVLLAVKLLLGIAVRIALFGEAKVITV